MIEVAQQRLQNLLHVIGRDRTRYGESISVEILLHTVEVIGVMAAVQTVANLLVHGEGFVIFRQPFHGRHPFSVSRPGISSLSNNKSSCKISADS